MNQIVAVDENWGIGRNGGLLIDLPSDLRYFKAKTFGKVVVFGRKTLYTFPRGKPLDGRRNVLLTSRNETMDGVIVCHSVNDVLKMFEDVSDDVFIIGGSSVYKEFLDFCDVFYITHILKEFDDVDSYFPNLDNENVRLVWKSDVKTYRDVDYYFAKYIRFKK